MLPKYFELFLYFQHVKKIYDEQSEIIAKKHGLHKIDFEILFFIHTKSMYRAKDIVCNTHFSKAHVSNSIERLSTSGYLNCIHDNSDKRCITLQLTQKALETLVHIKNFYRKLASSMLCDISADEIEILIKTLRKMAVNIDNELAEQVQ